MQGTASLQISLLTGGSVICLYFFSLSSIGITSVSFSHIDYSETSTTVVSAYFPEFDINMAGRLTGAHLSGKDNEFLINDDYLDNNRFSDEPLVKIGDSLTFAEKERICVGIISTGTADRFDFLINIDDFKNSINNGITAVFRFKDGTSVLEIKDFANEISAMLPPSFAAASTLSKCSGIFA